MTAAAGNAEGGDRALGQQSAKLLADIDRGRQIFLIVPGKGIFDHRHRGGAADRRLDRAALLAQGLIDKGDDLADLAFISGHPLP